MGGSEDSESLSGWSLDQRNGPRIRLAGYPAPIPNLLYGEVISSPSNGTAYTAEERIEMLYVFELGVDYSQPEIMTLPFWLGDGSGAPPRSAARRRTQEWGYH